MYLNNAGAISLNFSQYIAMKTENIDIHWSKVFISLVFFFELPTEAYQMKKGYYLE
jgi:hypothetical protein